MYSGTVTCVIGYIAHIVISVIQIKTLACVQLVPHLAHSYWSCMLYLLPRRISQPTLVGVCTPLLPPPSLSRPAITFLLGFACWLLMADLIKALSIYLISQDFFCSENSFGYFLFLPGYRHICYLLCSISIDGHNLRWIDGSILMASIVTIDQYFWSHFHRFYRSIG